MPIIDEKALADLPDAESLRTLIQPARKAAHAIGELVSDTRSDNRRQKVTEGGMAKPVAAKLRMMRNREYRQAFTRLKFSSSEHFSQGAEAELEALWKHPQLSSVIVQAPSDRHIIDKLLDGDLNFSPDEVRQILLQPNGLHLLRAIGGEPLAEAAMRADVDGKALPPSTPSPFIRDFLLFLREGRYDDAVSYLESDKTPPAGHILAYNGFYPIKQSFAYDPDLSNRLFSYLSPAEKKTAVSNQTLFAARQNYVRYGRLDLLKGSIDPTSTQPKHELISLFRIACKYGRTDIVTYCMDLTKASPGFRAVVPLDNHQRKKMLKEGFRAACAAGEKDVVNILRPMMAKKFANASVNKNPPQLPTIAGEAGRMPIEVEIPDLPLKVMSLDPIALDVAVPQRHAEFNQEVYDALIPWINMGCRLYGLNDPEKRASGFATIFTNPKDANTYIRHVLKRHAGAGEREAFSTATSMPLPTVSSEWDIQAWRKFIAVYEEKAVKYLPFAVDIEMEFVAKNEALEKEGVKKWEFAKSSLVQIAEWHEEVLQKKDPEYVALMEVPEIAAFSKHWGVRSSTANYCKSTFLESGRKRASVDGIPDHIPDIGIIDGNDFGHGAYYMMKLPKDDLRGLVIPHFITSVCTGPSSWLAKAHMLNPDVGLYVIMEKKGTQCDAANDIIVAKASVLRASTVKEGELDALAFNAWERTDGAKHLCVPFYREAALRAMMLDPTIKRVQMGKTITGHSATEWGAFKETKNNLHIFIGAEPPGDLQRGQYIVATRAIDLVDEKEKPDLPVAPMQHMGAITNILTKAPPLPQL